MSDNRERTFQWSDHYTLWNFAIFSWITEIVVVCTILNQNAFHFLFCYYTTTNVLLFSLMHFLVKPLKSWAMIDYDEMVLLQLLHTLYNTLPVYHVYIC